VELARAAGQPQAAGLVNAVLRKFLAKPRPGKPIVESVEAAAIRLGHPAWLVRRWVTTYGRAAALEICEYDQHQPAEGSLFGPSIESGRINSETDSEAAADLLDDGSRLVAELAAISHPGSRRIWDACAAPGGKTHIIARRCPDAEVLATDISPRRLAAMQRRLARELPGRAIRTLEADATKLPASEGNFDLILCDVPCSGTGTLARNPEIRHRLQASDLARQARRQGEILGAALSRLNPGGRLIYSTCSLEPEENEAVVRSVLGSTRSFRLIPVETLLDNLREKQMVHADPEQLRAWVRSQMLRTLPGANFRGDGFFAAVFGREG
jgi:16S rRNA (cytosine967-C5)-methyltransferase